MKCKVQLKCAPEAVTNIQLSVRKARSLTNGGGSWVQVVGVGVGVRVSNITNEELLMIININIINC